MNNNFIDLNKNPQFKTNGYYFIEPEDTNICITTKGKLLEGSIVVKPRKQDLQLVLQNIHLNSKNNITLDLRQGSSFLHKNVIVFEGDIKLESTHNIAVAVSNQQQIVIQGTTQSLLQIIGGSGYPALGNDLYCQGSGRCIFTGAGLVKIYGRNRTDSCVKKGRIGSNGVQFLGEDSGIIVKDSINVAISGGDGEPLSTVKTNKQAGNGGNAVAFYRNSSIEVLEHGNLNLSGGNGAPSENSTKIEQMQKPGNGGNALYFSGGIIHFSGNVKMNGGTGGASSNSIIPGNGGNCIYIKKDMIQREAMIKIGSNVYASSGDGGKTDDEEKKTGYHGCFIQDDNNTYSLECSSCPYKPGSGIEPICDIDWKNHVVKQETEEIEFIETAELKKKEHFWNKYFK